MDKEMDMQDVLRNELLLHSIDDFNILVSVIKNYFGNKAGVVNGTPARFPCRVIVNIDHDYNSDDYNSYLSFMYEETIKCSCGIIHKFVPRFNTQ